jgi:hypothetical protein
MELSHILNLIIVILILHLLIINLNFKKYINLDTSFISNKDNKLTNVQSNTVKENLEDYYEKSPQDELLSFINDDILASNTYSSNNNDSNFKSNVMKTGDFYNIEKDVELKKTNEYETPQEFENKYSNYTKCENIEQNQYTNITDLRSGKDEAIYHNPI